MVARFSAPLKEADVDTVVLGCTHYPFVSHLFQAALGPDVRILDTAAAVAQQTMRVTAPLSRHEDTHSQTSGHTLLWSSGDPAHLSHVARAWLGLEADANALPEAIAL